MNNTSISARRLACVMALLLAARFSSAREKRPKESKVEGSVVSVSAARLTVREKGGQEVTLTTREDFSSRVGPGAPVTAWVVFEDGVNVLESLDYPLGKLYAPPERIRSTVQKVILLPESKVPDADRFFDAVAKYVSANFGWYVAPRELAEEIRKRAMKAAATSALDAFDSKTGEFDMSKYLGGQQGFFQALVSETHVNAVLEVEIDQVMAKVDKGIASWDGFEEPLRRGHSSGLGGLTRTRDRGEVAASTVVFRLWDSAGQLLWTNRRGLAVLGVLEGTSRKAELVYRPLTEYMADSAGVENWLPEAFGSLLTERTGRKPAGK